MMPTVKEFARVAMRLTLVISVLYGTGAHWATLQGVAWAGMLATRVNESSWADAVKSTFSGEKPCHVCKIVEKGSADGKASTFLRSGPSVEFACSVFHHVNDVLPESIPSIVSLPAASSLFFGPVVPPPKNSLPA